MDNNYYQIYLASVMQLAASVVVKSSDTARGVNQQLIDTLGDNAVNLNDETTWRYHLNLCGEYHAQDKVMQVISLDTLATIDFTKDNLVVHTSTAQAYAYGTRNYKELVSLYPTQERLILGILYPCDMDTVLDAEDGTILSYPTFLVEETEYTLIARLEAWIKGYLGRRHNPQFLLSDNLYGATMYGIMFMAMVPTILNLRLAACKTNEAHSYHIRQYLASYGMLDTYMPYMTRSQMLFLYRNIAYIMRNSGKAGVFSWLVDHIMTARGLPLADFQMRHDLSAQPTNLTPTLNFRKRPLNTQFNIDQRNDFTLDEVITKEDGLAKDNLVYHAETEEEVSERMENALANKLPTKLLESTTIDYTGSEHYTLADTLLNHWMSLSDAGYYNAYVSIEQPVTGEILALKAKDALILYTYVYAKTIGITLVHLPKLICKRVMRTPKPAVSDLTSVVNPKVVPASFGQTLLDQLPSPTSLLSTAGFNTWCHTLWQGALRQYKLVCAEQMSNAKGQKFAMMSRCWSDTVIQLGTGQTYVDWFATMNLNVDSYNPVDLQLLADEILNKATGVDTSDQISLKDVQAAMVKIMAQLSSYSVQYHTEINANPIINAPCVVTRVDNFLFHLNDHEIVNIGIDVQRTGVEQLMEVTLDLGHQTESIDLLIESRLKHHFEITPKVAWNHHTVNYHYEKNFGMDVSYQLPQGLNNPNGIVPVLGLDIFLNNLTAAQQQAIPDIWH